MSALARWREIDVHSLGELSGALTTQGGVYAGDSAGYLSALHGFVAEQIAFDTLSRTHDVYLPSQTTVPAWDINVDGKAVQIKEGVSAEAAVHHARDRYPQFREFITDPAAARHLRAEGIDAQGIAGLEPFSIAGHTENSLDGLRALSTSGALHIPVLTTVFSVFRYWELLDEGKVDLGTALKRGTTDVAAQSLGAAVGLKLAAVGVVAFGVYAVAAVPLTAGAILGAKSIRDGIEQRRRRPLDAAIESLRQTEWAAEQAASLLIKAAREDLEATVHAREGELRTELVELAHRERSTADAALRDVGADLHHLSDVAKMYLGSNACAIDQNDRGRLLRALAEAEKESDIELRLRAFAAVASEVATADATGNYRSAFEDAALRTHERWTLLLRVRQTVTEQAEAARRRSLDALRIEAAAAYASLIERLLVPAVEIARKIGDVRRHLDALGLSE